MNNLVLLKLSNDPPLLSRVLNNSLIHVKYTTTTWWHQHRMSPTDQNESSNPDQGESATSSGQSSGQTPSTSTNNMANNGGQALVATIQMPLPARLDSIAPTLRAEHWPKRLNRFERYRIASQLHTKTNHEQVSTMLYSMGDCADDILSTLCIDETRATYDEVKQAFEDHFKSRRNVMVERARFNKRFSTSHKNES